MINNTTLPYSSRVWYTHIKTEYPGELTFDGNSFIFKPENTDNAPFTIKKEEVEYVDVSDFYMTIYAPGGPYLINIESSRNLVMKLMAATLYSRTVGGILGFLGYASGTHMMLKAGEIEIEKWTTILNGQVPMTGGVKKHKIDFGTSIFLLYIAILLAPAAPKILEKDDYALLAFTAVLPLVFAVFFYLLSRRTKIKSVLKPLVRSKRNDYFRKAIFISILPAICNILIASSISNNLLSGLWLALAFTIPQVYLTKWYLNWTMPFIDRSRAASSNRILYGNIFLLIAYYTYCIGATVIAVSEGLANNY